MQKKESFFVYFCGLDFLCAGVDNVCMQKYFDAHCHLQNASRVADVMARAADAGVCGAICNGTTPADWADVLCIARNVPGVYSAIGVHPWYVQNTVSDWATRMREILTDCPDIMVGEIGLDKYRPAPELQENIFIDCLDMAAEFSRPAFIHCVGAWNRVLQILKSRRNRLPRAMVAHAFAGSVDIMRTLADGYDFYFSYSPMIMDGRRGRLIDTVRQTPMSRILIESDDTDPAKVISVARRVAEIKSVDLDEVADTIYKNTTEILK